MCNVVIFIGFSTSPTFPSQILYVYMHIYIDLSLPPYGSKYSTIISFPKSCTTVTARPLGEVSVCLSIFLSLYRPLYIQYTKMCVCVYVYIYILLLLKIVLVVLILVSTFNCIITITYIYIYMYPGTPFKGTPRFEDV